MSGDPQPGEVNFLFQWKAGESAPALNPATDHVIPTLAEHEVAPEESEVVPAPGSELPPAAHPDTSAPDEPPWEEDFEWSADREQALFDALQQHPAGSIPRVHSQLSAILAGLESGTLTPDPARSLVGEVQAYLQGRVENELRKAPVAHEAFLEARSQKLSALYAWQECAAALSHFVASGDPVQLKVAAYAAEQGRAFLDSARDALLAADPEGC